MWRFCPFSKVFIENALRRWLRIELWSYSKSTGSSPWHSVVVVAMAIKPQSLPPSWTWVFMCNDWWCVPSLSAADQQQSFSPMGKVDNVGCHKHTQLQVGSSVWIWLSSGCLPSWSTGRIHFSLERQKYRVRWTGKLTASGGIVPPERCQTQCSACRGTYDALEPNRILVEVSRVGAWPSTHRARCYPYIS